jgi:hypothetical protein
MKSGKTRFGAGIHAFGHKPQRNHLRKPLDPPESNALNVQRQAQEAKLGLEDFGEEDYREFAPPLVLNGHVEAAYFGRDL